MNLDLRPYQSEAAAAVFAALEEGLRRQVVVLPTGTGKTVLFGHVIKKRGGKAIILAHRDELLDQAADKIRSIMPGTWVGKVKAASNESLAPVVVASIQTVSRSGRLAQLPKHFDTVVVDEAHHAAADSYMAVLQHLGCLDPHGPLTLGVTATPSRGDGVGLDEVFQKIVYERSILEMIGQGYLSDLRAKAIQIQANFAGLKVSRGDYVAGQAGEMLMNAEAPLAIAKAYREFAPKRKGIVFTPTVEVAHAVADSLGQVGFCAEALDGTTPDEERKAILRRLNSGETQIVANCGVLTEGFDEPSIDCIVMARPTKSRTLYVQCIGRGTRRFPGKVDCLILDLVGVASRHDLVSVNSLFGIRKDELDKKTVTEALEAREKQGVPTMVDGRLVAFDIDLMKNRSAVWATSGTGVFSLGVGDGRLVISATSEGATIVHRPRSGMDKLLDTALNVEMAMGIAESLAKNMGADKLVSRDAKWRKDEPTPKQLDLLRKWKVAIPPNLTKGEASALIDSAMLRRDEYFRRRDGR